MNGHYEAPDFLTYEAKLLLKQILNTDPARRITIKGIRSSDFYLKNVTAPEPRI